MTKKYKTDVKIRLDRIVIEECGHLSQRGLAERIADVLEEIGITLERGLDVTIIERTGSMQGKRSTVTRRKRRR